VGAIPGWQGEHSSHDIRCCSVADTIDDTRTMTTREPAMTTQEAGRQAETRAENYLLKKGFSTVNRNYSWKTGEIDLIMEKKDLLVFVEVRLRQNSEYGSGADSVTYSKQTKIINTAKRYLQTSGHKWESYRFDVVSIGKQIDWISGAFTLD
jgi:putative endonuclease